jgi:hypothetical protein
MLVGMLEDRPGRIHVVRENSLGRGVSPNPLAE